MFVCKLSVVQYWLRILYFVMWHSGCIVDSECIREHELNPSPWCRTCLETKQRSGMNLSPTPWLRRTARMRSLPYR